MTKQGGWSATNFGACLQDLRQRAGMTQAELAQKAGCYPLTISKLERGLQEPAWPLVLALAKALGVGCEAFNDPDLALPLPVEPKPKGRPKKPPAASQAGRSAGKTTSAPSGQKKPARGRKAKGE
jgi:transcriptional regulator with XRE-family HTH domain